MDAKELTQGPVGDVKLTLEGGKARIEAAGAVPGDSGITAGAFIECDANKLLDKIFSEVEKKSPAGLAPIEEGVKEMLKKAVSSI